MEAISFVRADRRLRRSRIFGTFLINSIRPLLPSSAAARCFVRLSHASTNYFCRSADLRCVRTFDMEHTIPGPLRSMTWHYKAFSASCSSNCSGTLATPLLWLLYSERDAELTYLLINANTASLFYRPTSTIRDYGNYWFVISSHYTA